MQALEKFDIRNFSDHLTPARGKNRYICPVCGGNNLTIGSKDGAYKCWSGECESKLIRDVIAPLPELQPKKIRPKRTRYFEYLAYDANFQLSRKIRVVRKDDGEGTKRIWQEHWNGKAWEKGLGGIKLEDVAPYRYPEVLKAIEQGQPIFVVEGEPVADLLWDLDIPATTNIGGSGKPFPVSQLSEAKKIVLCPDRDKPGLKHMLKISTAMADKNVRWCLAFPDSPLWNRLSESGGLDILDWVEEQNLDTQDILNATMDHSQFTEKLQQPTAAIVELKASNQKPSIREIVAKAEEILKARFNSQLDSIEANILLEELRREAGLNDYNWEQKYLKPLREKLERSLALPIGANQPSVPTDRTERRRLELLALSQERDPDKFIDDRSAFCRRYGWSRQEVEQRLRQLKTSTTTPKAKRLKGKDFLSLETESIGWVFPGIIPSRGVVVLGGHAGAGKTTLAYDAVGSLLLGEEFLGEKPVKAGRVLVVTGDELPCFTQDKLIDRGIPLGNEDWDIILNWDVSQWDVLEEAIADVRPALVIIDSFSSIHRDPSFDENSSQAKSTIYDLEALTNAYNCGCILIHHLSKSKENQGVAKLRGSSAIAAAASVVCLMEQISDGSRRLSFPKVRGAQTDPFLAHLDGSTGRYEVVSGGDDIGTKSLGDRILAFLQKEPYKRFEQDEISAALGIPSSHKDSVYQALGRLFKRGLITKRPSRLGGKRKVYGVTNPSQLSQAEGLRSVTDISQDTYPPVPVKVSVQNAETVTKKELEVTDTLTDNLTDSKLTQQNDVQPVSASNIEMESVSAKLTDKGSQGCVSPLSVATVTYCPTADESEETIIPDPWEEELAHLSPQSSAIPGENAPEAVQTDETVVTDKPTAKEQLWAWSKTTGGSLGEVLHIEGNRVKIRRSGELARRARYHSLADITFQNPATSALSLNVAPVANTQWGEDEFLEELED